MVSDTKLQHLVDNLYKKHTRSDRIGDGTTMDAVRNELKTGRRTQGTNHVLKAKQTARDLWNWTKSHPDASQHDRDIARDLRDRLENALSTKREY